MMLMNSGARLSRRMRNMVPPSDELWVCHLGHVPYSDGVAIQETVRARRQAGELPDTLLTLEHPPVYTRGRRAGAEDLPFPESVYRAKAIAAVGRYLRTMEAPIIAALAEQGIEARSRHDEGIDYTGVWVQDRKIASIGVHVSRGITTHGFAVNVCNDLEPFSWVTACGLPDVQMTSIAQELGAARAPGLSCFRKEMAYRFCEAHGKRQRLVSAARLGIAPMPAICAAPTGAEPVK